MCLNLYLMKRAFILFDLEAEKEDDEDNTEKLKPNINDDNYEYASLDTN